MNWTFFPPKSRTPDLAIAAWGNGKQRRYIFAAVSATGEIATANPTGLDGINGWFLGDVAVAMYDFLSLTNADLEALVPGGIGSGTLAALRENFGMGMATGGRGGARPGAGRKART